jgi:hypothetical protein
MMNQIKQILNSQPKPQPHNFTFLGNQDALFLAQDDSGTCTLFHCNFKRDPDQWTRAVEIPNPGNSFSKEEELLRERQRMTAVGVTSYHVCSKRKNLIVPVSGKLYFGEIPGDFKDFPVQLRELGGNPDLVCKGPKMDPKWAPDSKLVSFVRDGDVWVTDLRGNDEIRITHTHLQNSKKTFGVAEFIIQEEFDRFTGYWWANAVDQVSPTS